MGVDQSERAQGPIYILNHYKHFTENMFYRGYYMQGGAKIYI